MSTEHNQLKKNALSTWDVISQSLAFLGPVMSMAFLTAYIALSAGAATPLAVAIGGLTMIALGYVISQFASRVHAAGAIYNYAAKALGPEAGFIGGWVYMFAVLMLTIAVIAGVSGWLTEFLMMIGVLAAPSQFLWVGVVLVVCVSLFLLTYYDIRISTRTQLWLVLVTVSVVVLLAITIFIKGGAAGHSLVPFSFAAAGGMEGLAFGLIFSILMYTGFESAAVLAEETEDPKRTMPIAIIGTVVAAVVLYTFVTYTFSIGFGVADVSAWADPNAPAMFTMSAIYWSEGVVPFIFLAAIIDGFAVALGCLTTVTRVAFAMARDGVLPSMLSRTHPTYKTPYIATGVILALAFITAIDFAVLYPPAEGALPAYMTQFGFLSGIGAITIEAIYVFVGVAAIIWFRREMGSEYSIFKHLLVPIFAIAGAGAALYGSLLPQADPLLQKMPYFAFGWIALGVIYILVLRSSKPGLVAKIGRELSEMDS